MKFNAVKFEVLHFSRENEEGQYKLLGTILAVKARDQKVYMHSTSKVAGPIEKVVKKAIEILGFIIKIQSAIARLL